MVRMGRGCELCEDTAAVFCEADEAYICWTCDVKVHSANFLVARHARFILCQTCSRPTAWPAAGVDHNRDTYLCANCLEGECERALLDNQGAPSTSCVSAGVSETSCECDCASSSSESIEEKIVDEESTSTLTLKRSRNTLACLDVSSADSSLQASATSDLSLLCKEQKPSSISPSSRLQSNQTTMRSQEDVREATSHQRQCESDAPTSINHTDHLPNQGQFPETRGFRTPEPVSSHLSGGASNRVMLSRLKQRRINDNRHLRPSQHTRYQRTLKPTARLMRMLAKWHWDLHLSSPLTVPLAIRFLRKKFRALSSTRLPRSTIRTILAACLRLAARLDEAEICIPEAHKFASCAGISATSLAVTEIQLLGLLEW